MTGDPPRPDAILERLLQLHPKLIELSLDRIERLLAALGDPQLALPPTVHVAGTNGKGSTIAFLRAFFEAAGQSVHVYTSPHLVHFNERIRLGGEIVSDALLSDALATCEAANDGAAITFFEITTAAAFLLFHRHPADVLLLETGLGGRVDATNVVPQPVATVVTPISFDHPEFLGRTIAAIAGEKAGILKRGVPALIGRQTDEALDVLQRTAARLRAPTSIAGQEFTSRTEGGRFIYEDERGLIDMPLPRLAGGHQRENAALAIATLRSLQPDLPASIYEAGVLAARWPARLQHLTRGALVDLAPSGAEIWLDGGHNAEGGRVLAQAMADFEEKLSRPLVLICGLLTSKDAGAFLRAFKGLAQELLAVPLSGDHAGRAPDDVAATARAEGIAAVSAASVETALRFLRARAWPTPPRILIAGSLYLAGDVLAANGTPPT